VDTRVPGTPGAGAHLRPRPASPREEEREPEAREVRRERTPFRKGLFSGKDRQRDTGQQSEAPRGAAEKGASRVQEQPPRGSTEGTDTGRGRDVQLLARDPVKLKKEIAEIKKLIAADAARNQKVTNIPVWLKKRQSKREVRLAKLESMLA